MAEDKYLGGIHYRIKAGKKRPFLVFIHSWATDITEYGKQLNYFERKGHSTLAVDLRGSGKSESKPITMDLVLNDVKSILDFERINKVVLVGYSLGGFIALGFLKNYPDYVKKLVLISSLYNLRLRNICPGFKLFIISFFPVLFILQIFDKIKLFSNINFSKIKTSCIYLFSLYTFLKTPNKTTISYGWNLRNIDYYNTLNKISIPVLIITGGKDEVIKRDISFELHNKIKNSKLKVINRANHLIIFSHPGLTNEYIEEFL